MESTSTSYSDGIDGAGTDQPGPRARQLHPQSHSKGKRSQSLHLPLSNIPEEGQGEKEMMRTRAEIAEKNGYIKLESEHGEDDGSDSGSRSSSGSDYVINTNQKPERDEHRHERLKQSEQCENLRILSSSSSSQTDLNLITNADLENCFPESPYNYSQSRQLHEYQKRQNQHESQNLILHPSSTESIVNSSTYESTYGSIDDIDNDNSTLRSLEQSSSIDTSVETSDAPSSTTVKVKNSIDLSRPFSNDYNGNDSPENQSYIKHINDAVAKSSSQHPNTPSNRNLGHHNYDPFSSGRKSRLNDRAQAPHDHHIPRQEQRFSHLMSKNSIAKSPSNISNSNNSIHSESMPILSNAPSRHYHNHHKKHCNKNMKKIESLHKIHTRQNRVAIQIGKLKGVEQSKSFRDVQFSLLFFVQVGMMIGLAYKFGPEAIGQLSNNDNASTANSITSIIGSAPATLGQVDQQELLFTCQHFIMLAASTGVISIVISTLALIFMTLIAEKLVQIALCLAMSLALAWGTIGAIALSSYSKFIPITGLALVALITAYAFVVWDRIPFASANLKTALTAIRSRPGILLVTFGLQILMLIWAILTMFTVVGIYNAFHSHVTIDTKLRIACYVLLGVSFFWSVQLLLHIVHLTVAGVVKNWWFHEVSSKLPQPSKTHSSPALLSPSSPTHPVEEQQLKQQQNHHEWVVARSFRRAAFHSLGSVCYGSLLVFFVRTLRRIPKYTHPCSATRDKLPTRFHSYMDALGSKFNRFAFIYVGLYGYSFVEAGERASALLNKRGWKKIVTDNLINDLLLLVSLVIGGVSGCLTVWIESFGSDAITSSHHPMSTSFLIGYTVSFVLSSILFGIISSSVNAVIILFAGNPVEFEENHPELSHGMRAAWREVFPGKVDFVETEEYLLLQV